MSWVFSDGKEVAEIDSCRLHAGEATLGAFQVVLAVRCVAYQSQDKTPWKVWPSGARVWLFKNPEQRVFWGYFLSAGNWVAPPLHDGKPHKQEMAFAREFTASEIAALEEWRSGEDATLKVIVYGSGVKGAEMISHSYFREHDERVPRSRWSDLLRDLRFRETLHIQVPVGIDSRGDQAGVYLREAMSHRERGDYSAVALSCRKAIEALGQAGFGRKGPKEIVRRRSCRCGNRWTRQGRAESTPERRGGPGRRPTVASGLPEPSY